MRRCKNGYAISFEGNSCIQFENREKLAKGDKNCSICAYNFHPKAEGECERALCEVYDDNDVCTKCFVGYYLNDIKMCQKITIENCLEFDEKNEKCSICIGDIPPDENGNCNLPSPLIKGCTKYDSVMESVFFVIKMEIIN